MMSTAEIWSLKVPVTFGTAMRVSVGHPYLLYQTKESSCHSVPIATYIFLWQLLQGWDSIWGFRCYATR